MKRSTIAATLSFFLPGAGLWYLGERQHAAVNLMVACGLTVLAAFSTHEHVHYVFLAIAAGSAGYAHAAASTQEQPPGPQQSHSRQLRV